MKITPRQQAFLDGFTCERLKSYDQNYNLLWTIRIDPKHKSDVLASLQRRGWSSDSNGTIAYYLVKDPEGQVVFFFSLRCGLLCDPEYIRRITELRDLTQELKQALKGDPEKQPLLQMKREKLGEFSYEDLLENLPSLDKQKNRILDDKEEDDLIRPEEKSVFVDEIHAAVELVEMGVNEARRACWDKEAMGGRSLGETMFWHFVVDKMLAMSELVGCEYAYLFAAGREDGSLVDYYRRRLHFIVPRQLGAVKPGYDKSCVLMCKKLFTGSMGTPGELGVLEVDDDWDGLDQHRKKYFENFNNPRFC